MAAVSCALSEEQFLCSICLEVFSAPVTAPCGHSFCRTCINQHWDTSDLCTCPVCKQDFSTRPQLKVNVVLAEMVFEFRNNPKSEDAEEENVNLEAQFAAGEVVCGGSDPAGEVVCGSSGPAGEVVCGSSDPAGEVDCGSSGPAGEVVCGSSGPAGEVVCDMCLEPRLRALKSCLVCLASYCESHLQPHLTNPRLKRHQLIEAQLNLEERMCHDHDRPLELFCKDHSHFICLDCTSADHKDHEAVPLKEESEAQQTEVKEQIKERLVKIQQIRDLMELSQKNADTEIQEGIKVFNTLIECVQQRMAMFKQNIEEQHRKREEEAAELIKQMQTEISELEQRGAEMEQIWSSGDHLQFVQTFTSAKPAPQLKDWKESKIDTMYVGILADFLTWMKDGQISEEIKKVYVADFKKMKQYYVYVTLDKNTCHQNIRLEYGDRKAQYTSSSQDYSYHPDRFSSKCFVLGDQAFSSGKFYFEVTVKGSRQWAVGVARESVERYRNNTPMHAGFFLLEWDDENLSKPCTVGGFSVNLNFMPPKIGVFVDYEKGVVSFYCVRSATLIQSLTHCRFKGKLRPLISPGDRSGAMQITKV